MAGRLAASQRELQERVERALSMGAEGLAVHEAAGPGSGDSFEVLGPQGGAATVKIK